MVRCFHHSIYLIIHYILRVSGSHWKTLMEYDLILILMNLLLDKWIHYRLSLYASAILSRGILTKTSRTFCMKNVPLKIGRFIGDILPDLFKSLIVHIRGQFEVLGCSVWEHKVNPNLHQKDLLQEQI